MEEKHIFSFYYKPPNKDVFIIESKEDLYSRIAMVLRMREKDIYTCFDGKYIYSVLILEINKKNIINKIISKKCYEKLDKYVIAYIPYLEREYMNEVFYILGQQGIDEIQLVKTELSHMKEYSEKDYIRFNKLMIQGCEQGKQYKIPFLHNNYISMEDLINKTEGIYWFYDQGNGLESLLLQSNINQKYSFLCGPERGYSINEVSILKKANNFYSLKLSNYILRSVDVVSFASILFKSL